LKDIPMDDTALKDIAMDATEASLHDGTIEKIKS
jgi:hypothetical protein